MSINNKNVRKEIKENNPIYHYIERINYLGIPTSE